jgi:uncharacterized membrane protein YsdA (DUF1294 family)
MLYVINIFIVVLSGFFVYSFDVLFGSNKEWIIPELNLHVILGFK